eukprot:1109856-Rhodomonas_salina.1
MSRRNKLLTVTSRWRNGQRKLAHQGGRSQQQDRGGAQPPVRPEQVSDQHNLDRADTYALKQPVQLHIPCHDSAFFMQAGVLQASLQLLFDDQGRLCVVFPRSKRSHTWLHVRAPRAQRCRSETAVLQPSPTAQTLQPSSPSEFDFKSKGQGSSDAHQ